MIFERTYYLCIILIYYIFRLPDISPPPLPAHHAAVIIGFRGGHEVVGPGDKESRANTIKSGRDKTMFAPSFFVQKN